MGFRDLVVEGDALTVIKKLKSDSVDRSAFLSDHKGRCNHQSSVMATPSINPNGFEDPSNWQKAVADEDGSRNDVVSVARLTVMETMPCHFSERRIDLGRCTCRRGKGI
ncbi:hypothetical protein Golob_026496 [Gossypium lobatum]|uniref:RNase H type-1 domain-containing protein n=1 Tax=Gossypium lobatum TaxID=34289 RepID=A0A7J8LVL3_9ROSI|nr:hypothetical protein [Gossypium lobatum]